MPSRIRSNPAVVLLACRQRLLDKGIGTEGNTNLVVSVDQNEMPPLVGDRDFLMAVGHQRPEGNFDDGSGRYDARIKRFLNILIRTRVNLDRVNDWKVWLTDQTLGHLDAEWEVMNTFHDWTPVDAQGNELGYQSLIYIDVREPRALSNRTAAPGWGGSVVSLELPIQLDLDNADQSDQYWS